MIEYQDPHPGKKGDDQIVGQCVKCGGSGVVNFGNVSFVVRVGGRNAQARWCFDCGGSGQIVRTVKNIRAAERRRVREAAKAAERAAESDRKAAAWAAANPVVSERLHSIMAEVVDPITQATVYREYGDFIYDIANHAVRSGITEAQTVAVAAAIERHDARVAAEAKKAAAQRFADAKVGNKITVNGTVAVATTIETRYGFSRLVVVEGVDTDEGVTFKMFGTGASLYEVDRGDRVEVTGAIKDFETYEGTPQTVMTRAKVKVLSAA